jgi:hypothetical protein
MGDWQTKFRQFFQEVTGRTPKIQVQPKRRWSGPRETPSDWWTDEGQQRVNPKCGACRERHCAECMGRAAARCALCREPVLPGEPLKMGLCGPCWLRTFKKGGDAA